MLYTGFADNSSAGSDFSKTLKVNIDNDIILIEMEVQACDGEWLRRGLIYVDDNVKTADDKVAKLIMRRGAEYVKNSCETEPGRIDVWLYRKSQRRQERTGSVEEAFAVADLARDASVVYKGPELKMSNYTNSAARRLTVEKNRLEKQRIAQERLIAKENQRKEQERITRERRTLLLEFLVNSNVKTLVEVEKLTANPFVYEDKIVVTQALFANMLNKNEAIFGVRTNFGILGNVFIVSKVPSTRFTEEKQVLLAGHVLGNKTLKTPSGGEATLTHLEFVDAYEGKYSGDDLKWALTTSKMSDADRATHSR